tara:strand:- start:7929 stop:9887 length:1959 start_codon:yes stop_codon:yes gene_type:complete
VVVVKSTMFLDSSDGEDMQNHRRLSWTFFPTAVFIGLFVFCVGVGASACYASSGQQVQWVGLAQVKKLDSVLQNIKLIVQDNYEANRRFSGIERTVRLLKGRMGKALGLQWSQGFRVGVFSFGTARQLSWFDTFLGSWPWERWKDATQRLQIAVELPLQSSFFLRFGLRRMLNQTALSYSEDKISGVYTFWFRMRKGAVVVLALHPQRVILHAMWSKKSMYSASSRYTLWRERFASIASKFTDNAYWRARRRLQTLDKSQTQVTLYIWPKAVLSWLANFAPLEERWWRPPFQGIDGIGLAGHSYGQEVSIQEQLWLKKGATRPPFYSSLHRSLAKLVASKAQWIADVAFAFTEEKTSVRSVFGTTAFQKQLHKGLRALWKGMGLSLSTQALFHPYAAATLRSVFGGSAIVWGGHGAVKKKKPTPTTRSSLQVKDITEKAGAVGYLSAMQKLMLQRLLSAMPGFTRFGLYGHQPYYVFWEGKEAKIVIGWRKKYWVATNDLTLFHDILTRIDKEPKQAIQNTDTQSLMNLRVWGRKWEVFHVKPSTLDCCWMGCKVNNLFWQLIQRLDTVEAAVSQNPKGVALQYRVLWSKTARKKDTQQRCTDVSPFWRGVVKRIVGPLSHSMLWRAGVMAWRSPLRTFLREQQKKGALPTR